MPVELLVFRIDERRFALNLSHVREVLRAVTLSPALPPHGVLEGWLNLRGRLVGVFDLRQRLGLPARPIQHTDYLVVLESAGELSAIRCDGQVGLVEIGSEAIEPVADRPGAVDAATGAAKVNEAWLYLLDPQKLLQPAKAAVGTTSHAPEFAEAEP
jgi:chemotaxis signal transduction protein